MPLKLLQRFFYVHYLFIAQNIEQNYLFCTLRMFYVSYFSMIFKKVGKRLSFYQQFCFFITFVVGV